MDGQEHHAMETWTDRNTVGRNADEWEHSATGMWMDRNTGGRNTIGQKCGWTLTFWDGKEANDDKSILVCSSHVVLYVAN